MPRPLTIPNLLTRETLAYALWSKSIPPAERRGAGPQLGPARVCWHQLPGFFRTGLYVGLTGRGARE